MEGFFNRLLISLGYNVCSKPHIQGLMHWFSCVPDMDFEYVLSIIANGNPCKYWAPLGESCPVLSDACMGHSCAAPGADASDATGATPAPTAAPTPTVTTLAPTEAPSSDAPTEAPTDAPTNAPTDASTVAPTDAPTDVPTDAPTVAPTNTPTDAPTEAPTA